MVRPTHPSIQNAFAVAAEARSDVAAIQARLDAIETKTDLITITSATNLDNIRTEVSALPVGLSGYESRIGTLEGETHTVVLCSFEPDATTPTIQSEIGISTVARLGTGRYRLTYDTAFADTDYIITSGCGDSGGRDYYVVLVKYTGYVDVAVMYAPSDVWSDGADSVSIAIWNP